MTGSFHRTHCQQNLGGTTWDIQDAALSASNQPHSKQRSAAMTTLHALLDQVIGQRCHMKSPTSSFKVI